VVMFPHGDAHVVSSAPGIRLYAAFGRHCRPADDEDSNIEACPQVDLRPRCLDQLNGRDRVWSRPADRWRDPTAWCAVAMVEIDAGILPTHSYGVRIHRSRSAVRRKLRSVAGRNSRAHLALSIAGTHRAEVDLGRKNFEPDELQDAALDGRQDRLNVADEAALAIGLRRAARSQREWRTLGPELAGCVDIAKAAARVPTSDEV